MEWYASVLLALVVLATVQLVWAWRRPTPEVPQVKCQSDGDCVELEKCLAGACIDPLANSLLLAAQRAALTHYEAAVAAQNLVAASAGISAVVDALMPANVAPADSSELAAAQTAAVTACSDYLRILWAPVCGAATGCGPQGYVFDLLELSFGTIGRAQSVVLLEAPDKNPVVTLADTTSALSDLSAAAAAYNAAAVLACTSSGDTNEGSAVLNIKDSWPYLIAAELTAAVAVLSSSAEAMRVAGCALYQELAKISSC